MQKYALLRNTTGFLRPNYYFFSESLIFALSNEV